MKNESGGYGGSGGMMEEVGTATEEGPSPSTPWRRRTNSLEKKGLGVRSGTTEIHV